MKHPTQKVRRVDRSPLNAQRWIIELACGHGHWVSQARRPGRKTMPCDQCKPGSVTGETISEAQIREVLSTVPSGKRQNAHTRSLRIDCEGALEGSKPCRERVADVYNAHIGGRS